MSEFFRNQNTQAQTHTQTPIQQKKMTVAISCRVKWNHSSSSCVWMILQVALLVHLLSFTYQKHQDVTILLNSTNAREQMVLFEPQQQQMQQPTSDYNSKSRNHHENRHNSEHRQPQIDLRHKSKEGKQQRQQNHNSKSSGSATSTTPTGNHNHNKNGKGQREDDKGVVVATTNAATPQQKQHEQNDQNNNKARVVVYKNIVLKQGESLFWKGAQSKLCHRIRKEQRDLKKKLENRKQTNATTTTTTKLRIVFAPPCQKMDSFQRHGNLVLGLYGMQLAAMSYRIDFVFQCQEESKQKLPTTNLFGWLQTKYTRSSFMLPSATHYKPSLPTPDTACRGMGKASLYYTSDLIRNDLQTMAFEIIKNYNGFGGGNHINRDQAQLQESNDNDVSSARSSNTRNLQPTTSSLSPPSFVTNYTTTTTTTNLDLDDVAIHFRCGDVLSRLPAQDNNYGLIPFRSYVDRINTKLREGIITIHSIGIITTSFDTKHLRKEDSKYGSSCQRIVTEFVSYLSTNLVVPKSGHHNITITIRNDPKESIPVVYTRMILAKITFCVRSTFCLLPAIANYNGTSYIQQGGVAVLRRTNQSTTQEQYCNDERWKTFAKSSNCTTKFTIYH